MQRTFIPAVRAALAASLSFLIAACGGGSSTLDSPMAGSVSLKLTDAPACGFDAVNVTVQQVRIHQRESAEDRDDGWITLKVDPAQKINLLDLQNGVLHTLGQASLPAGKYTQLRLVLAQNTTTTLANSVVPTGGTEIALDTPSGQRSGIKLVEEFTVSPGQTADIVLDFDACKSILKTGNGHYKLKPVIHIIPVITSGTVVGWVALPAANAGATVSAQTVDSSGKPVIVRATPVNRTTGQFKLAPIGAASNYTIVVTAPGYAATVIKNVPVTTGSTTTLASSVAPLTPSTSVMRVIDGVITPIDDDATVRALQTLNGGPSIEVGYDGADEDSGRYRLLVPAAAPLVGTYSATLPFALTADPTAAGQYAVEATVEDHAPKTANVDVSAGNVTQNFAF